MSELRSSVESEIKTSVYYAKMHISIIIKNPRSMRQHWTKKAKLTYGQLHFFGYFQQIACKSIDFYHKRAYNINTVTVNRKNVQYTLGSSSPTIRGFTRPGILYKRSSSNNWRTGAFFMSETY